MRLKGHIIYSTIPALILAPFVGVQALVFFVGAVLIDVDHYLCYVFKFKDFDVKGMFDFVDSITQYAASDKRRPPYLGLCIFHTLEFFILLGILSFYSVTIWYLLLGILFHMAIDIPYLHGHAGISSRALSLIEYFIRIGGYKEVPEFDRLWYEHYKNGVENDTHKLVAEVGAND